VYVQPQWRRQGVYRRLYQQVQQLAAAQGGVRGFRLYVEKNNHTAQRTYTELGMRAADYLLFEDMDSINTTACAVKPSPRPTGPSRS